MAVSSPTDTLNPATNVPAGPLSLRHNFSWVFAGDLIFNACQWAMIAVLAKTGTANMVGQYALALAITAPAILFTNLNLRAVQATDARNKFSFRQYATLRAVSLIVFVGLMAVILWVTKLDAQTQAVVGFIALAKMMDALGDLTFGMFQRRERMDYISISRVLQGVLQLTALTAVVALTGNIVLAAAVIATVSGLVFVFYNVPTALRILNRKWTFEVPRDRRAFETALAFVNVPGLIDLSKTALPLGLVSVLYVLNGNIPRYFLSSYTGVAQVGVFAAMWSLLYPAGIVLGTTMQVLVPRAARCYIEDIERYKAMMKIPLFFALASGVLGVLCAYFGGSKLLTLLFRPEYGEHWAVFVWVMIAGIFYYLTAVLGDFLSAARCFLPQPIVGTTSVIVNMALCSWLVPRYGLQGAAWSYLAGCITWMLGYAVAIGLVLRGHKAVRASHELHDETA